MTTEETKEWEEQRNKAFDEMAKVVEKFMQDFCHPHNTLIASLDGIEIVEGIKAKPFEVVD